MIVYLSGGMHSGWQDEVKDALAATGIVFLDPRDHGLDTPGEYTKWDIIAIRACDIVLAHAEATNPSHIGMAAEIGFAKGLNKLVVYIQPPDIGDKYLDFLWFLADICYIHIDDAAEFLKSLLKIEQA